MDYQKIYDSILEDWLPTQWSRRIAGLTPSLAISGIFLPNFLQKIDIHPSQAQTLLIRLLVPPTICFVGTFLVLLMVVRHYKALKLTTLQTQSSIKPFQANEQELNILRLLYNQDKLTTEQIAQSLSFEIQTANFYLEELKVNNMTSHNFTRGKHDVPFMSWSIKQEGRRCLIEIKKTS